MQKHLVETCNHTDDTTKENIYLQIHGRNRPAGFDTGSKSSTPIEVTNFPSPKNQFSIVTPTESGSASCQTCASTAHPGPSNFQQAKFNLTVVNDLPMTKVETEQFQLQLARATISAGLSERWIEDPEIIKAFRMLRTILLPNRRKIGGHILQTLLSEAESTAKVGVLGEMVTLVADGWKNVKRVALISYVVKNHGKVFTLKVDDVSLLPKTGKILFGLIDKQLQQLHTAERGAKVVAVCTDDGADCKLATKQISMANG